MGPFFGSLFLVVVVAGVVAGLRALLWSLGEARASVAAAATAAVLAAVTPTLARATGLVGAVVVLGALGVASFVVAARRVRAGRAPRLPAGLPVPWSRAARRSATVLFVLLAIVAVTTFLWDEASTHLPLAGAAARGVFPLEHPLFPGQPLRYHPGFAVLGGVVRAFTGLPLDLCLDVVTLAGIALLLWSMHDLACALGLSSAQAAGALPIVLLTGGPLAGLLADGWGAALPGKGLLPTAWVNGATFPPLVVTNVFQHPQGLALPIVCAALLLASTQHQTQPRTTGATGRLLVAAALVLLCSRVQIVLAAFCGLAVLVIALRQRAWGPVVALMLCAVIVVVDSGFSGAEQQLVRGGAFASDGLRAVPRELLTFGVSLGAPLFAWWLFRHQPRVDGAGARAGAGSDLIVALAVVGSVGFVAGNVVSYARSWDIVKLFGASAFFANFLFAAWAVQQRRAVTVVVAIVVVASCWSGALWLLRHGALNGVVAAPYRERGTGDDVAAFLDVWGPSIGPRERVFSPELGLARAGFLVPGTSWRSSRDTAALLLDRGQTEALTRAWQRAGRDLDDDALQTLGASFIVVRVGSPLSPLLADRARFEPLTPRAGADDAGFRVLRIRR